MIRVQEICPASRCRAFRVIAYVCETSLVRIIEIAIGCTAPYQGRKGLKELTEAALALLKRLFRSFAIVNIEKHAVPAEHTSLRTQDRLSA
jgi:hypothetical protein